MAAGGGQLSFNPERKKNDRIFVVQRKKMHIFSIVNLLGNFMIWRGASVQRTDFPSVPTERRDRVLYAFRIV